MRRKNKVPRRKALPTDERHKQNKSRPKRRRKPRPRRDRVCPVHDRALVQVASKPRLQFRCPEPGCEIRRGGKATSTPCDAATGNARKLLHDAFDPLWHGRLRRFSHRNRAYQWLAGALGLSLRDCHIGKFTLAMCERGQVAIRELLKTQ